MSTYGFTDLLDEVQISGISSWRVKAAGDSGWYDLGPLNNGQITATLYTEPNSRKAPQAFGIEFKATARIMCTDKTFLQMLSVVVSEQLTHSIRTFAQRNFGGALGLSWKLVCEGDYDKPRYVEIESVYRVLGDHATLDDWNTLTATQTDTPLGDTAEDLLYGLTPTTQWPAGFSECKVRNTGETNWEAVGEFRNCSFSTTPVMYADPRGRARQYGVAVSVGFDMPQAWRAKLVELGWGKPDFQPTLADGTVFSFADILGIKWVLHNDKEMEDPEFTRVTGEGAMTMAEFIAAIS